jgi:hypothetical protein
MAKRKGKRKTSQRKIRIPLGLKIIAILTYVKAFFLILGGIGLFLGGIISSAIVGSLGIDKILQMMGEATGSLSPEVTVFILSSLILGGVLVIIFGIIAWYIGRGLWRGRNWARVVVIVLMAIAFIEGLVGFDLATLIFSGIVGGYLWFNKDVQKYYSK